MEEIEKGIADKAEDKEKFEKLEESFKKEVQEEKQEEEIPEEIDINDENNLDYQAISDEKKKKDSLERSQEELLDNSANLGNAKKIQKIIEIKTKKITKKRS